MSRLGHVLKKYPFLYQAGVSLRTFFLGNAMRAIHLLRGTTPCVVFSSFHGLSYSDGPRRVSESLHALAPRVPQYWLLNVDAAGKDELPDYIHAVRYGSFAALQLLSRASVAVDNFNLPFYRVREKGQHIVQLWHGDRPFKKIQFDVWPDAGFIDEYVTDLFVVGSSFGEELCRRAFRYRGDILKTGTPRDDILASPPPGLADRIRQKLGIAPDARVLLYAPTFRDALNGGSQSSSLSLSRVKEHLGQGGEHWITLSRGHADASSLSSDADRDVSSWPDMNELLLITDLLITDYSSCAGDYALLDRPMILWRPDEKEYTDKSRELYFTSSPFRCARDEEELFHLLDSHPDPAENCRAIREFFGTNETGHASDDTARAILKMLEQDK